MDHKTNENKRDLIHSYLNNEMSLNEENTFKKTKDYFKYKEVFDAFENTKSVSFNEEELLHRIVKSKEKSQLKKNRTTYKKWLPLSIAASLLLFISLLYFLRPTSYTTDVAETTQISLPDNSIVWLNAKSKITPSKNWGKSRNVALIGEAYFEVAKGKIFSVTTPIGVVTVLGTKFNVKQRNNSFEVHCFEGSVSVLYGDIKTILKPNELFTSSQNHKITKALDKPNWILQKSVFKQTSLTEVVSDISLHYDIEILVDKNVENLQLKYTGSYHYSDDLNSVLEILSQSLNLNYELKNRHVNLTID